MHHIQLFQNIIMLAVLAAYMAGSFRLKKYLKAVAAR